MLFLVCLFIFMVLFIYGRTRRDERGCPSLHCLLRGTRSPLFPWLTGLFHGGVGVNPGEFTPRKKLRPPTALRLPPARSGGRGSSAICGARPGGAGLGLGTAAGPGHGALWGQRGELVRQACLLPGLWSNSLQACGGTIAAPQSAFLFTGGQSIL